jgi:hypothetical protein
VEGEIETTSINQSLYLRHIMICYHVTIRSPTDISSDLSSKTQDVMKRTLYGN